MKKIVAVILLLCMVLTISACGKVKITMQDMYDAAQTEAMLANHKSVYVQEAMDGEVWFEKYTTKDYVFSYMPGDEEWVEFMTDDTCYCYAGDVHVLYLPVDPNGLHSFASDRAEKSAQNLLFEDCLDEIIESATKEDGRITVESVLSQKNLEMLAEDGVISGKSKYVLDAKSRELISIENNYNLKDDVSYHTSMKISYDVEEPELVKTFLAYEKQTENLRNITIVSNPGTAKEVSQSVQAPKGLILGFRYDDEAYVFEAFNDAACTETYDPYADTESDLTIYIRWTE